MFDTYLTVVGVVITNLDRRRVESTGATVVNFRVASTSRRFDKESGAWTDRETLFLGVTCWRQLGENAFQSLYKGDPVVVTGRVYSRSFTTTDGTKRWTYEMDAAAVGHNLDRGVSSFVRNQRANAADLAAVTSELAGTVEDPLEAGGVPGSEHEPEPEGAPHDADRLAIVAAAEARAGATERMVGAA
jgi:single-strand DNA-binding protein